MRTTSPARRFGMDSRRAPLPLKLTIAAVSLGFCLAPADTYWRARQTHAGSRAVRLAGQGVINPFEFAGGLHLRSKVITGPPESYFQVAASAPETRSIDPFYLFSIRAFEANGIFCGLHNGVS